MRNDSGQVQGTLCPEYFCSEDRKGAERCVGIAASGKVVIPSKGHLRGKLVQRRAVKECYCYAESRKAKVRAKKTSDQRSFPCDYCRSNFDVEIPLPNVEAAKSSAPSATSLGDETLRRVERITYSPTSEFLRRVQKKLPNQKKKLNGSCSEITATSLSRPSLRLTRDSGRGESAVEVCSGGGKNICSSRKTAEIRCKSDSPRDYEIQSRAIEGELIAVGNEGRGRIERRRVGKQASSPRSSSACVNDDSVIHIYERKDENAARKPRSSLKKTIRSGECGNDGQRRKERSFVKHSPKRIVRTISAHSRCCAHDNSDNSEARRRVRRAKCDCETRECPESRCCLNTWQLFRDRRDRPAATSGDNENKVRELNKFRNDNYFETHGSTRTLITSSRSSGSLEQYVLNDRLFPEAVRRIHRDDIMVTMPSCATKQRKRIHYFPRHVVKQEKSTSNTNYSRKKRRSQSCGLTGHAVDLGILKKPCEITNSLALRYQKGVMMANK